MLLPANKRLQFRCKQHDAGDLEHLQRTGSSISDSYADDSIPPPQLQETWHQLDLLQQQRQHQQFMDQVCHSLLLLILQSSK